MRAAALVLVLLPFLVFAGQDAAYHLRGRKPGLPENLTHLVLGASQVFLMVSAFRADVRRIVFAALLVAVFGAIDELGFHRALPARESDLHAKAHFALFSFVALALAFAVFPDLASVTGLLHGEAAP